jgi:hypothetical protein
MSMTQLVPLKQPGHLATDGFLSCVKSIATAGYLYCPGGGGGKRGGFQQFDTHMYRLRQEDDDVLAVILAASKYLQ